MLFSDTPAVEPDGERTDIMDSIDTAETAWMADGHCAHRDPSMFFPSDGVGVEIAKAVCADCPVKSPCLEYALEHRIDHGVWGGTSERERRRILRSRRIAVAEATPVSVG